MNCYAKLKSSSEWIKVKEAPVDQKGKTISVQCSDVNFPKNYSINIFCDFSSIAAEYNASLVIIDEENIRTTVKPGKSYITSKFSKYFPFVDVYVTSSYCNDAIYFLKKIIGNEINIPIRFDDRNITDKCVPYSTCFSSTVPSQYTLGYSSKTSDIKQLLTNVILHDENPFDTHIYLTKSEKCNDNREIMNIKSSKNPTCKTITLNDIPSECLDKAETYKICFDISNFPSKYQLSYKIDSENEIKPLTKENFEQDKSFSIKLYLTSNTCTNKEFREYTAKTDFKCVSLTKDDVPDECEFMLYYIKIQNKLDSTLYK